MVEMPYAISVMVIDSNKAADFMRFDINFKMIPFSPHRVLSSRRNELCTWQVLHCTENIFSRATEKLFLIFISKLCHLGEKTTNIQCSETGFPVEISGRFSCSDMRLLFVSFRLEKSNVLIVFAYALMTMMFNVICRLENFPWEQNKYILPAVLTRAFIISSSRFVWKKSVSRPEPRQISCCRGAIIGWLHAWCARQRTELVLFSHLIWGRLRMLLLVPWKYLTYTGFFKYFKSLHIPFWLYCITIN